MKKSLAFLLCAVLVLSLFAGCGGSGEPAQTTEATEYVPRETPETKLHEPAAEFAGGSGTEADPYQISDASHLALLNQKLVEESETGNFDYTYTNAYYILAADISLNDTSDFDNWADSAPEYGWVPIGRDVTLNNFCGVFDGNGHTISGMYINADAEENDTQHRSYGLFAEVEGTVKNLTIDQSYICVSGGVKNVGAVAGSMVLDKAKIENCVSNAVIETYDDGNVGGIVGSAGVITGCTFSGTITQSDEKWSQLGGISGSGGEITDCTNLGTISGSGYAGGIVGYGSNVTDCINRGTVSGDTAGGITGNLYCVGTGLEVTVTKLGLLNCVNEGQVSAISYAGGIAGKVGNDEVDIDMYVSGCENYGQVTCDAVAAGIIGNLAPERANILNVENCVNYADITGKGKVSGVICELTGAILHQEGHVTIAGCENHGNITSTEGMYSGGILTYFMLMGSEIDLNLTIENCTNTGNIASSGSAGGILCFCTSMMGVTAENAEISDTSAITLRGCVNTGSIQGLSSNSFVGGIAGNLSAEGIHTLFENCVNTGDVQLELNLTEEEIRETVDSGFVMSISQMVGGMVGRLGEGTLLTTDHDEGSVANVSAENAWIVFRNCYSSGSLDTTDYSGYLTEDGQQIWKNYIGGIVGNTCAEEAYSFRVENCGYANADRGLGNEEYPDVGEAMTTAQIEAKLP